MNHYPLWKYLLLLVILSIGTLYALPNLYPADPALQVSARTGTTDVASLAIKVEGLLKHSAISNARVEVQDERVLVRFENDAAQLAAKDLFKAENGLGDGYVFAPNLVPATPDWMQAFNARPMYLGLDLRGGIHLLMQIDMDTAVSQSYEGYRSEIRNFLREQDLGHSGVEQNRNGLTVRFNNAQLREAALSRLQSQFLELELDSTDTEANALITVRMSQATLDAERSAAMEQNLLVLRNRVNELGVAEPVIQRQGTDRVVVQLPGIQDSAEAIRILGSTATLEYRLVTGSSIDWQDAAAGGRVPANALLYKERNGSPVLLERRIIVTGDQIKGASTGFDEQSGSPAVIVRLDGKGASKMAKISAANIGKPMAVVFIEQRDNRTVQEVISIATIRDVLRDRFQTTGLSMDEARDLSLLLRAGALRAPMKIIEERTVGASLGIDNVEQGRRSVIIGFVLVMLFMLFYYRAFGLVANMALFVNLVLMIAVLSMFQATLTLPGIAGIVLTVGMAVDANVLIFERIREELRNGNSVQASIQSGYDKAFTTIADANVTTLIAAVVLFSFGTGPIKGFAVTLTVGILTSMFTAIMGTRAIVNLYYGGRRLSRLSI